MPLVKEFPKIKLVNDDVIIELKVHKSGKMVLHAPAVHPREICKLLAGLQYDLMYGCFQMQEKSSIVQMETSNGI